MRRALALSMLAALGWLLAAAAPASAHTDLLGTTPAEGETVESLEEVRLEFSGELLEIGAELVLTVAGEAFALEPTFPEPRIVAAEVPDAVSSGDATLAWRVVAEDGHPIAGTVAFAVTGDPVPSASGEPVVSASPSAAPSPEPSTSSAPTEAPAPGTPDEAGQRPIALVWIAVAVAVLGTATAIVMRSRR